MIPFWTLFSREIHRFLKVLIQTVITPLVSSFLYLLIFGVSLGGQVPGVEGSTYLAFLVPGLMMMGLMNNAFQNSSSSIVSSKFSGDLEDLRVAPLSDDQILWALSCGGLIRGAVVALVTFVVGTVFHRLQQEEFLGVAHPWILAYFVLMGGLIFGLAGIAVAFWAKTFDQLSAISAFVLLPLTYLGGVFLSIEHLHPFWQLVSKFNPLFYLINGLRYGVLGVGDVDPAPAMWVSAAGLFVFYVVAKVSLRHGSFQRW